MYNTPEGIETEVRALQNENQPYPNLSTFGSNSIFFKDLQAAKT